MPRKNIFLCAMLLAFLLGPGAALGADGAPPKGKTPADPALCARIDDNLTVFLTRPQSGHFVAMALAARRALDCGTAAKSCELVAQAMASQIANRKPEQEVLSTLGLNNDLDCPGQALADLLDAAARWSAQIPVPGASRAEDRAAGDRTQPAQRSTDR